MKEPDPLDTLLRDWKSPAPPPELDQRVISAYRSERHSRAQGWRRLWTMRVSVPVPALVAAALALWVFLLWLRPPGVPAAPPETPGAVTQLNARGFQPLPNGDARVVPAAEVQK